jgi:peptidoglycan hydrolase-like protein with peptidoglycan-binding domain
VKFPVGVPASSSSPAVRLANLRYGLTNDDVKDLQRALNRHLSGPDLPVTGFYGDQTDAAVRRCQQAHDLGEDAPRHSFVGSRQAAHLGLRVTS